MSNLPRFYCPSALDTGAELSLPAGTARHVQVLRLQPNDEITLFNGQGGEFKAVVMHMGRSEVSVRVGEHQAIERELHIYVHLWSGITANERMDWLLEKATELGAATLLPITAERSVLKLKGERADKKLAHWQAIAVASSEQCGRNRVLQVGQARTLEQALEQLSAAQAPSQAARWVLSLSPGTRLLHEMIQTIRSTHDHDATQPTEIIVLSGPEINLARFSLKLLPTLLNCLKKANHSNLQVKKMPNHLKKWLNF